MQNDQEYIAELCKKIAENRTSKGINRIQNVYKVLKNPFNTYGNNQKTYKN